MDSLLLVFLALAVAFWAYTTSASRPKKQASKASSTPKASSDEAKVEEDRPGAEAVAEEEGEEDGQAEEADDSLAALPSMMPLRIIYATTTGTSKAYAEDLQREAFAMHVSGFHFDVDIVNVADYDFDNLEQETMVLFLCPTWEGGAPPETAATFFMWLEDMVNDFRVSKTWLSSVRYAVFGLGSSVYADRGNFGTASAKLDRMMAGLGAQCVAARGLGDDTQNMDAQFEAWRDGLWPAACEFQSQWQLKQQQQQQQQGGASSLASSSMSCGTSSCGTTSSEQAYKTTMSWEELDAKLDGKSAAGGGGRGGGGRRTPMEEHIPLKEYRRRKRAAKLQAERTAARAARKQARERQQQQQQQAAVGAGKGGLETKQQQQQQPLAAAGRVGESKSSSPSSAAVDYLSSDEEDEDGMTAEDRINSALVDMEDLGDFVKSHAMDESSTSAATTSAATNAASAAGGSAAISLGGDMITSSGGGGDHNKDDGSAIGYDVSVAAASLLGQPGGAGGDGGELKQKEAREMVTPLQHRSLTKEGYQIIGTHSAVKLCRWTKNQLRGRGGCYKHTMYGITSYQCMETTPSLACANKCVFCWRHHKNPVGREWRWKVDDPDMLVDGAIERHQNMIRQCKGIPGVQMDRWNEAFTVKHCALSLVGEPIMYPHINRFVGLLHTKGISTFLVTNAQFPDKIAELDPVTQLYVSIDAATKDTLKAIDRPLFQDFWERFLSSLDRLREKGQRTVYRLTLVKEHNMEEVDQYCELIARGQPDFIEIKAVTFCGKSDGSDLTMDNVPWHREVCAFAEAICAKLAADGGGAYELACAHEHSCCTLIAKTDFKVGGKWHTWIDYDRFEELIKAYYATGKEFVAKDYMAETPDWAVYGAKEAGFDPIESRFHRTRKGQLVKNDYKPSGSGCG